MTEPAWIVAARRYAGLTEIVGVRHEPKILAFWKRVKAAWFKTDEVPWCGAFIGNCLAEAGMPILPPAEVGRALAWARYGDKLNHARVGTIGVKQRKGGGHVFFVVGINAARTHYAALGGNQGNAVSIVWIAKREVVALRWPPRYPVPARGLPILKNLRNAGSEA